MNMNKNPKRVLVIDKGIIRDPKDEKLPVGWVIFETPGGKTEKHKRTLYSGNEQDIAETFFTISVGDVGTFRRNRNFLEGETFADFEREGQSISLTASEEDAVCKNCGAANCLDKFRTHIVCKYCGTGTVAEARKRETFKDACVFKQKIGKAVMLLSVLILPTIWVVQLAKLFEFPDSLLFSISILALVLVLLYIGFQLWWYGKKIIKVRAFVVSYRGFHGNADFPEPESGYAVFEADGGIRMNFSMADEVPPRKLEEGDVGLLYYLEGTSVFNKFEYSGKSASLSEELADGKCRNCGSHILVDKYSTKIKCCYCGNIIEYKAEKTPQKQGIP
jgi:DNA-directed RNA polymerase subunit RPC12/RpoP